MGKDTQTILIENDLRPAYYDGFHCLAGACRLSCCSGHWRISFSKRDYLNIKKRKCSPELDARLEQGMRRTRRQDASGDFYAEFPMGQGACPLLDEDGLCALQREQGAGVLPRVCKEFPRREIDRVSGYLERSLSPACEGVLALLWEHPEGVEFRSDPLPKEEQKRGIAPEDNPLTEHFQDIRSLCIDFLQDRRRPLAHRILLMGLAMKGLADGERDIPGWLNRGRLLLERGDAGALLSEADTLRTATLALLNNVRNLLSLRDDKEIQPTVAAMERWLSLEDGDGCSQADCTAYFATRERYRERFGPREYFMENLMVSVFFYLSLPYVDDPETLWRSYVSFCNLYAAYRFIAVMSCRDGAPGDRDELFRLIVTISRVLIHGPDNRNRLRDEFFENGSATLAHMAILLCGT